MKYLHLFPDSLFTESYIELINKNFEAGDHQFYIFNLAGKPAKDYSKFPNSTVFGYPSELAAIYAGIEQAEQVFLHGLTSHKLLRHLFFNLKHAKKSHWIVWGADLYYYRIKKSSLYAHVYEWMRKTVIRNFRSIISFTPSDIKLIQEVYRFKGKVNHCFFYPGALLSGKDAEKNFYVNVKGRLRILLGNSATRENNHLGMLDQLAEMANRNFEIICPLSYGSREYADKVIAHGKSLFGDDFHAHLELVPLDEYLEMLNTVDVAIFDFNRQQGLGNILILLRLGKKVFLRRSSPVPLMLEDYRIRHFYTEQMDKEIFVPLSDDEANTNRELVESIFSEEKSINGWRDIFEKQNS